MRAYGAWGGIYWVVRFLITGGVSKTVRSNLCCCFRSHETENLQIPNSTSELTGALDTTGNMVEHYADGDLVTIETPMGYAPAGHEGLAVWGPEVPAAFLN